MVDCWRSISMIFTANIPSNFMVLELYYLFFRVKSIFGHPTLASVWFWPLNSKTGYLRPSNYQNHSLLAIRRFCRAVLLTWTSRGGGAHLSVLPHSFSLFSVSLFLSSLISLLPSDGRRRAEQGPAGGRPVSRRRGRCGAARQPDARQLARAAPPGSRGRAR